jgi:hypothetical protein
VFITRLRRPAELCAIVSALLMAISACALAADPPVAAERYLASYGQPDPVGGPLAREAYYSSYGTPRPLNRPHTPAASDGPPWLPIGVAIAGSAFLVVTTASRRRRAGIRRRVTRTPA